MNLDSALIPEGSKSQTELSARKCCFDYSKKKIIKMDECVCLRKFTLTRVK